MYVTLDCHNFVCPLFNLGIYLFQVHARSIPSDKKPLQPFLCFIRTSIFSLKTLLLI